MGVAQGLSPHYYHISFHIMGLRVHAVSVFRKKSDAFCGFLAYFCAVFGAPLRPPQSWLHFFLLFQARDVNSVLTMGHFTHLEVMCPYPRHYSNRPFLSYFYLCFLSHNLPYGNKQDFFACSLSCKSHLFPYERMCTRTCFETLMVKAPPKWHINIALPHICISINIIQISTCPFN